MTKWNDIPYEPELSPEIKGIIFDLQIEENGGDASVTHQRHEENDCE